MGDPEIPLPKNSEVSAGLGCAVGYIFSPAGIIRLLNVILGIVALSLWIPGYEHEFLGERSSIYTGDTTRGWGNGVKRETLNQFVLAAIIICLACSVILVLGLVTVQHAAVDWNRFNKLAHLGLGIFLMVGAICSVFGVWYYQENCCHVDMEWRGVIGVQFRIGNREEGYVRHCYCYLTRYLGQSETEEVVDTVLYDPNKNTVDTTQFNENWRWAAHHIYVHVAAIFIIFINSVLYLIGFFVSKSKTP